MKDEQVTIGMLENSEGVEVRFIEEYRQVFRSPLKRAIQFPNWVEAANFVKLWSTLPHIKWW